MSSSHATLPLIVLLLITFAQSHKRGDEYTYMSMFVKPRTPDMIEGDNHLGRVYEQLSTHPRFAPHFQTRRSLRSQSEDEEEDSEGDAEEEDEDTSDSDPDQESSELPNSDLTRLAMSDKGRIAVKVSEESLDDEEEEADDENDSLRRETMPPSAGKIRLNIGQAEEQQQHQDEIEEISEQLGKKYGEDLYRIQTMLLKIIVQYDIKSMADVPCRAHAHWMSLFLKKVTAKKKDFRYYCVDTRKDVLKSVKETMGSLASPKFILRRFWMQGIPRADLVFSWAGLDNMKSENVVNYLTRLSKTGKKHKLIAIGSHSGELKKKGSKSMIARFTAHGHPINVRERPFRLKRPMRIIGELSNGGNDKQLYLYEADDMKE